MELYNWQLCEYTCVRSACLQILHQGIGDPRPRALFALAVLLSHRKILRPLWFPREGWWGRGHPCYKVVVANKFQSWLRVYFFWVWRLNNKQHWFVAATCWARTNVKGDHIMVKKVIKWGIHAALCINCKWHGSTANDANSIEAKGSPALDLVTWSIHQRAAPRWSRPIYVALDNSVKSWYVLY